MQKKRFATTLADAMTSDAASSQPRKRGWKRLIVALACVVAIALVVLFLKAPTREPVTVTFLRSTNYNGGKKLVFRVTNGLPRRINYVAGVDLTRINPTQASAAAHLSSCVALGDIAAGECERPLHACPNPAQVPIRKSLGCS